MVSHFAAISSTDTRAPAFSGISNTPIAVPATAIVPSARAPAHDRMKSRRESDTVCTRQFRSWEQHPERPLGSARAGRKSSAKSQPGVKHTCQMLYVTVSAD